MKMKSKLLKISAIVLVLLMLIVFVVFIFIQRNAGKLLDDYLQAYLSKSEISQVYDIQFDEIGVRPISGKIKLKGLKIKPRDSFFTSSDSLRFRHPLLFDIEVDKILIAGLIKNLSFRPEEVSLKTIKIQSPDIKIINHLSENEKAFLGSKTGQNKKKALSNQILLPQLNLKILSISNGRFEMIDRNTNNSLVSIEGIDVHGNDIVIAQENETFALNEFFNDLTINLSEISYPTKNGFYLLSLKNIELDLARAAIKANDFKLIPQFSIKEFGVKSGKQTDRMDLSVKNIAIRQIDFDRWLAQNEIWIDEIVVHHVYLDIFRDKNVPRDLTVFPKLPHQQLAALDVGVNIGKLGIYEAEILYQELMPGAAEPGMVVLSDLEGSLLNISNIASVKNPDDHMQWMINGTLYKEGKFEVTVDFSADQPSGDFSFYGMMGEMDMSAFNQILVPNEHIRID
ncbi:MAG: hypothetical protein EOM23_05300, partial [Candidatus Moranbacteria bacterium]|nr:hypothetical protein [Candidatus Moranbacteria bacterium]